MATFTDDLHILADRRQKAIDSLVRDLSHLDRNRLLAVVTSFMSVEALEEVAAFQVRAQAQDDTQRAPLNDISTGEAQDVPVPGGVEENAPEGSFRITAATPDMFTIENASGDVCQCRSCVEYRKDPKDWQARMLGDALPSATGRLSSSKPNLQDIPIPKKLC